MAPASAIRRVYDAMHSKWIAVFLASGCGGQGLGVWTSNDGVTWGTGPCAHSGGSDDRESSWVDNNPSSPFYGRAYISWNNFAVGGGAVQVVWSNDGGATWTAPVTVVGSFFRDVQMTIGPDGHVFVATMDEGGGGLGTRTNIVRISTNGGANWSSVTMGPGFPGPGVGLCSSNSYFAMMYPPVLAAYGLGRHRCRPGQHRPLRVCVARGGERQGRHLLRALDRQRRHLEHSAPARR